VSGSREQDPSPLALLGMTAKLRSPRTFPSFPPSPPLVSGSRYLRELEPEPLLDTLATGFP
jgi:hypothetical protein